MKIDVTKNTQHAELVRAKLRESGGYCPCKLERTPDTKCICKEFREQKSGPCHCGLYIKTAEPEDDVS